MGDEHEPKTVRDYVGEVRIEPVPQPRPPRQLADGFAMIGYEGYWLRLSELKAYPSTGDVDVWGEVHNFSNQPFAPGEIMFRIKAMADSTDASGMSNHQAADSTHLNEATWAPGETKTIAIGSLSLDPGAYWVWVDALDPATGSFLAKEGTSLHVVQEGRVDPAPKPVGGDDSGYDPLHMAAQITDIRHIEPAPDGTHEYWVCFKLSTVSDSHGHPYAQPNVIQTQVSARNDEREGARNTTWLYDPIPQTAWEAQHELVINLSPGAEWRVNLDVGLDRGTDKRVWSSVRATILDDGSVQSVVPD
jgi:hypothetical protein